MRNKTMFNKILIPLAALLLFPAFSSVASASQIINTLHLTATQIDPAIAHEVAKVSGTASWQTADEVFHIQYCKIKMNVTTAYEGSPQFPQYQNISQIEVGWEGPTALQVCNNFPINTCVRLDVGQFDMPDEAGVTYLVTHAQLCN